MAFVYVIIGVLLLNGMPHFVAGRGGQVFRTPFARRTAPGKNALYGAANFVLAAGLTAWAVTSTPTRRDVILLLIGAAATIVYFAFAARTFFTALSGEQPTQSDNDLR